MRVDGQTQTEADGMRRRSDDADDDDDERDAKMKSSSSRHGIIPLPCLEPRRFVLVIIISGSIPLSILRMSNTTN
jgi:hypothetical protein